MGVMKTLIVSEACMGRRCAQSCCILPSSACSVLAAFGLLHLPDWGVACNGHKENMQKRTEKTTPFGVNLMRRPVLNRAAHVWNMHRDTQPATGIGCRHGFVGILLLAAWPNAAFDLCGICCGHFLMPFWDFFGATFIGKALLKVHSPSCLP